MLRLCSRSSDFGMDVDSCCELTPCFKCSKVVFAYIRLEHCRACVSHEVLTSGTSKLGHHLGKFISPNHFKTT